jgi:hypothetical protein
MQASLIDAPTNRLAISGESIDLTLGTTMSPPKVFISYAWESDEHRAWVKSLAARLRGDGVETVLDQWELSPGDQLPRFMERSVRESNFILIMCTPKYQEKSDGRLGGVGYEGDIMAAEVATGVDRRKFIPLLRSNAWASAAPSWLRGSYYLDVRGDPYPEENYSELIDTLHGRREKAPPVHPAVQGDADEASPEEDEELFEVPAPLETYMRARAWLAETTTKYPIAVAPSKVGWYDAMSKAGGGYFYDEVLEYRVWVHPHAGGPELHKGDDYFCAFPSYEEALAFSTEMPGAEVPLALVLQREHVDEPEPGVFEHVVGDRRSEWRVEWLLEGTKREPDSIKKFLEDRA